MDIKVGDIVTIWGQKQRVMQVHRRNITLSHTGMVNLDNFERYMNMFKDHIIIEHVTLPQLNIGDLVVVQPITMAEKSRYGLMWWPEMDEYIGRVWPVTHIRDTEFDGQIVTLGDGQDFQIYHLEKINDYDIV